MSKESKYGRYLNFEELHTFIEKIDAPSTIKNKLNSFIADNQEAGFLLDGDPAEKVDKLIDEISRRVFGTPVADLSPAEQTEIDRIRKEFFDNWDPREQFTDFH